MSIFNIHLKFFLEILIINNIVLFYVDELK